jgi:hypothetical protein
MALVLSAINGCWQPESVANSSRVCRPSSLFLRLPAAGAIAAVTNARAYPAVDYGDVSRSFAMSISASIASVARRYRFIRQGTRCSDDLLASHIGDFVPRNLSVRSSQVSARYLQLERGKVDWLPLESLRLSRSPYSLATSIIV